MTDIITIQHFEEIRKKDFADLIVSTEQRDIILQTINTYLLRMIKLNLPFMGSWQLIKFKYVYGNKSHSFFGSIKHIGELYLKTKTNPKKIFDRIQGCKLYTAKTFRKMLKEIGINQRIYISTFHYDNIYKKLRRGRRRNAPKLSSIIWFNWLIYLLITRCFSAMKEVGFEKMFETQELSGFFNISLYINKYMTIPMLLDEYENTLTEKEYEKIEMFQGIPYNKRISFLNLYETDAKTLFYHLQNVLKTYDI